jgi:seryl-tRNA synthetase
LEKEHKSLEDSAQEKEVLLNKKLKTIGNYVHESVPVSNNEVRGHDDRPKDHADREDRTITS